MTKLDTKIKKVTEFRLYPTDEQMTIIDLWLTQLKWVWNTGICALEESQQRTFRVKAEWTEYSPVCADNQCLLIENLALQLMSEV